ncbi:MAG TPA: universal stress protein [Baekduia sp.]|uniref:universal stress protein n=1 Tax=Baekduia sp. TaxID=2600305 RepID=UPI002D77DC69|nr:universal stress protein [Baekduia sp.]HET6507783.1 universal stress protein [Baekduia sp.]
MSVENPSGPLVLCYDGSEAAERAIRIAPILVGRGRPARLLYAYKPTERSLGVAQALSGGSIDAPVHSEPEAEEIVARGVAIAREAGFEAEPLLKVADRRSAELIAQAAEDLDAPAIVMGQRGLSGFKSAVLGSVSRDVVNAYHRPVVLV